ncbi:hypothetical protein F2Q70_00043323 [Brassica cretica]|uniref:Uncharacterized protein n=1 Tax=Brassica cretica TaxID=69181 RepID=A0A8S9KGF5_BRACR|nr:hypothetical protein F2Q70_00043323 [Brassica cretica]
MDVHCAYLERTSQTSFRQLMEQTTYSYINATFQNTNRRKKDEYGIYRDDQGYARDLDGHTISVHNRDIIRLLERASRDEPSYICLPEHASLFTQTKLVPEIYTKDKINECSMESVENTRRTKKPSR